MALGQENARLAAYEALFAGAVSNTAALGRISRGNVHRASQKSKAGCKKSGTRPIDARLIALVESYHESHPPDHSGRTMAKNLAARLGRKVDPVRSQIRRFKQMDR